MIIEAQVASHYTRGDIERTILDGLAASGKNIEKLTTADLSAADELHLGWLPATMELASRSGSRPACTCSTSAPAWAGRAAISRKRAAAG
jgi:hypothetical protein